MIKKFLCSLVVFLLLGGCVGSGCIAPNEGVSSSVTTIEVPAKKNDIIESSPATYWVDSGEEISTDQTIKLSVSGAINLCPRDSITPVDQIIPAYFCNNGDPDYKISYENAQDACATLGGPSSEGRYIDTGLKVNSEDILRFNLIPRVITFDNCKTTPKNITVQRYYSDDRCKNKVDFTDMCENGGDFYISAIINGKNECQKTKVKPLIDEKVEIYVDNSYSPYGNKVGQCAVTSWKNWIKTNIIADMRLLKPDFDLTVNCNQNNSLSYSSHDINCRCNTYCTTSAGCECPVTMFYSTKNNQCSTNPEDWISDGFITRAGLLVAKIGGTTAWDSVGECLETGTQGICMTIANYRKDSLRLNHHYLIKDGIINSPVMLAISDQNRLYFDNVGGYNVKIEKSCARADGKKLFMYIGDDPPQIKPGENGTWELHKTEGVYEINKDNPPLSGKIYFGVDLSGIDIDDQFNGLEEHDQFQNNKYQVNLFLVKWQPKVSSVFIMLRNVILSVLYGVPKESDESLGDAIEHSPQDRGAIRAIYKNHSKSLAFWHSVQALFVLFITFTSLGYIIGAIRLSGIDLIIRLVKMSVIVMLFSENSWDFFGNRLLAIFAHGADHLIGSFSGYLKSDNSFKFLDTTMGLLISGETWLRFLSLFFAGPMGWLIFFIILWASFLFLKCFLEAIVMYLMIIVSVSFLVALAPLFLVFLLFQVTRSLFDGWIRMLASFALQPIILFAALALFNQIIWTTLYQITNYHACTQCALPIPIAGDEEAICLFNYYLPIGFSNDLSMNDRIIDQQQNPASGFFGLPFSITAILMYLILAQAMSGFLSITVNIAHTITGSVSSSMIAGAGRSAFVPAADSLLSIVGLDRQTQAEIKQVKRAGYKGRQSVLFKAKDSSVEENSNVVDTSARRSRTSKTNDKSGAVDKNPQESSTGSVTNQSNMGSQDDTPKVGEKSKDKSRESREGAEEKLRKSVEKDPSGSEFSETNRNEESSSSDIKRSSIKKDDEKKE